VFRTAGYAVRRQSVDRNTTNVIAGDQSGVVHEALNVLKEEAMSDGPLNEAKALDMVGLKSKVVGPAALSSRGLGARLLTIMARSPDPKAANNEGPPGGSPAALQRVRGGKVRWEAPRCG
jgi:hypothetical protein